MGCPTTVVLKGSCETRNTHRPLVLVGKMRLISSLPNFTVIKDLRLFFMSETAKSLFGSVIDDIRVDLPVLFPANDD